MVLPANFCHPLNLARRLEQHGYSPVAALALLAFAAALFPTEIGVYGGADLPRALGAVLAACVAVSVVPVAASLAVAVPDARVLLAAAASAGAAAIHFAVISEHVEEYWLFGLFFFLSGAAQLAWAILVVLRPLRLLIFLGVVGNAATIGLWVLSRTAGLPLGPDAGEPETIGTADVVASTLEGLLVVSSVWYLTRPQSLLGITGSRSRTLTLAVPVLIATVVAVALIADGSISHHA